MYDMNIRGDIYMNNDTYEYHTVIVIRTVILYRELSSSPNDLHGRVMDKCCAAAEAGCSSRSSFNVPDISPSSSTGNDASCIMDILCNANANMPYKLGSELDSISSNIVSGECGIWLLEDDDEECVMS